jgi:hypothetical protein
MLRVLRTIVTLFGGWVSLMSGGVGLALAFAARFWTNNVVSDQWMWIASLFCICFAAVRAVVLSQTRAKEAEEKLALRRPQLSFGSDWTFPQGYTSGSSPLFSPYYLRNDGEETAHNITVVVPARFAHIKILCRDDYPADHVSRPLQVRVGQQIVNLDLDDAIYRTSGVEAEMTEYLADHESYGIVMPLRIEYFNSRGEPFAEDWEIVRHCQWTSDKSRVDLGNSVIRLVHASSSDASAS